MEQKTFKFELKNIEENGVFSGYASTFGNKDRDNDIIEKGAFNKSLEKIPASNVKLLWQHDMKQPIGQPLEIIEDSHGLAVKGKLFIKDDPENNVFKVEKAREAFMMLKGIDGQPAIDGFSIGFNIPKGGSEFKSGVRHIKQVNLHEFSVVTFAANPEAKLTGIKNMNIEDCKTIKDFEERLRDSGKSKKEAQVFISDLKTLLSDSEEQNKGNEPDNVEQVTAEEWGDICLSLKKNQTTLKGIAK